MPTPERICDVAPPFVDLPDFVDRHRRLFVLTGAGCSTASGSPDYRDTVGLWKRAPPMTYQIFMGGHGARQRYWARSMVGWRHFASVKPNDVHRALAVLEAVSKSEVLLTQNVDRLHQKAGSTEVIDLHGRLDRVRCMGCERRMPRDAFQVELERLNPDWLGLTAIEAPDGDSRGRTCMIISHRFSTVRMADRILVLNDGRVEEAGAHAERVALGGRYATLFELQASGYR